MSDVQNNYQKYHSHISSNHKWFDLKIKETWQYRDLIWLFTKRSFVIKYKQTILGPAWLFISPILTSLVYMFVFGGIANIGTDGVPSILFYLTGTALWTYFSTCFTSNANTFTANAAIFGKVYFPRLTTPVSNILSALLQFVIQMILVVVCFVVFLIQGQFSPNWLQMLWIPVILIHLGVMGMGFGLVVSSLTTKYRDLTMLVGFGVSLWTYATPVAYPLSIITNPVLKTIAMINPVTMPMELFKSGVLGVGTVEPLYMVISVFFTIVVTILGIVIFNKVERNFMDTV